MLNWLKRFFVYLGRCIAAVWGALERLQFLVSSSLPGSTRYSRGRNAIAIVGFFISLFIFFEIGLASLNWEPWFSNTAFSRIAAKFLVFSSFLLLGFNIAGAFAIHDRSYLISGSRLIRDICISALLVIASFALIYRFTGLTSGNDYISQNAQCYFTGSTCICDASILDTLYFSVVTFSTLGFGDLTACSYKLLTAVEALLGNIHLGLFVGAVFYYLSEQSSNDRNSE